MAECGQLVVVSGDGDGDTPSPGGSPIDRARQYVNQNPRRAALIAGGGVVALALLTGDEPARRRVPRVIRGGRL